MIGVSIFGALLLGQIASSLAPLAAQLGITVDLGEMQRMAMMGQQGGDLPVAGAFIKTAISDAMSHIFTASLLIVTLAIVAILFVPQIQLRGRGPQNAKGAGAEAQPPVPVAD
jgi:hypothetical protein